MLIELQNRKNLATAVKAAPPTCIAILVMYKKQKLTEAKSVYFIINCQTDWFFSTWHDSYFCKQTLWILQAMSFIYLGLFNNKWCMKEKCWWHSHSVTVKDFTEPVDNVFLYIYIYILSYHKIYLNILLRHCSTSDLTQIHFEIKILRRLSPQISGFSCTLFTEKDFTTVAAVVWMLCLCPHKTCSVTVLAGQPCVNWKKLT